MIVPGLRAWGRSENSAGLGWGLACAAVSVSFDYVRCCYSFRLEGPDMVTRWALLRMRSQMASAIVGSPRWSCQLSVGSWLVMTVERSNWLLGDGPQVRAGKHDGGVLGWITDHHPFVYPEIIGYYLTSLKFICLEDPNFSAECESRAGRALDWLQRQVHWRTRDYLCTQPRDDWRNSASFSFDSAMVLGGASHWLPTRELRQLAGRTRDRALAEVQQVPRSALGVLGSHRCVVNGPPDLPVRWSTLRATPRQGSWHPVPTQISAPGA